MNDQHGYSQFRISAAPPWIVVKGGYDDTCELAISTKAERAGAAGTLKVSLLRHGALPLVSNVKVVIAATSGNIQIRSGGNDAFVELAEGSEGIFDFRLWRTSRIEVGKASTSNGIKVVCDNSIVVIGPDCMFSDDILIQAADQHGIVDLNTGEITNNKQREVVIGEHVWLGRGSVVMPDVRIGKGVVIGTGSIVTKDVPEMTIAAGVPARVVRNNCTWTRATDTLDPLSRHYLQAFATQD